MLPLQVAITSLSKNKDVVHNVKREFHNTYKIGHSSRSRELKLTNWVMGKITKRSFLSQQMGDIEPK